MAAYRIRSCSGRRLLRAGAQRTQAGLYRPGLQTYALDELPALAARGAVAWCVAAAVLAAFDRPAALHWLALLAAVAAHAALAAHGAGIVHGVRHFRAWRRPPSALVVGSGQLAQTVARGLHRAPSVRAAAGRVRRLGASDSDGNG